jgi:hypothetical protein
MAARRTAGALVGAKGTALVESAVAMSALALMTSATVATLYVSFARVWIERSAYEGAICLAGTTTVHACESRLRRGVGSALPIGSLSNVNLSRTSRTATVKMRFKVGERSLIHEEKILALPLGEASSRRGSR